MAPENTDSKPSRSRRTPRSVPDAPAWEVAIETQRARLLQVQGLLHCLHEVLLYADDEHAVTYADLAQLAGEMVGDCVSALDTVRLRRPAPDDPMTGPGVHGDLQLREPSARYMC